MKCPGSTLKCFADEIQVLIEEWDTIPEIGVHLKKKMERLARTGVTQTECRQCELHKEQSTERFLNDLYLTIQKMNSQNCNTDPKKTH